MLKSGISVVPIILSVTAVLVLSSSLRTISKMDAPTKSIPKRAKEGRHLRNALRTRLRGPRRMFLKYTAVDIDSCIGLTFPQMSSCFEF